MDRIAVQERMLAAEKRRASRPWKKAKVEKEEKVKLGQVDGKREQLPLSPNLDLGDKELQHKTMKSRKQRRHEGQKADRAPPLRKGKPAQQ